MKRTVLLTILIIVVSSALNAQTLNVHFKEDFVIKYTSDQVEFVDFLEEGKTIDNDHEYVDLGLPSGIKWATCNIGANSPQESGDYFAWGEVDAKTSYNLNNYSFYHQFSGDDLYDELGKNISGTQYDVAQKAWGGTWRMPTEEEFIELLRNCSWYWKSDMNVCGFEVVGENGNEIFLPVTGYIQDEKKFNSYNGYYWTATSRSCDASHSFCFLIYDLIVEGFLLNYKVHGVEIGSRYIGLNIRPVLD